MPSDIAGVLRFFEELQPASRHRNQHRRPPQPRNPAETPARKHPPKRSRWAACYLAFRTFNALWNRPAIANKAFTTQCSGW